LDRNKGAGGGGGKNALLAKTKRDTRSRMEQEEGAALRSWVRRVVIGYGRGVYKRDQDLIHNLGEFLKGLKDRLQRKKKKSLPLLFDKGRGNCLENQHQGWNDTVQKAP